MAHTYYWEEEGLYRKFFDEISGEEILTSNFEIHNEPEFINIKYIINDFNDVSGYTVKKEHTGIYAKTDDIISNTKGKLNIAIVVKNEELKLFAESYRQQMKNRQFTCEIFDSLEEARDWVAKKPSLPNKQNNT